MQEELAALSCERLRCIETYYDKSAKVRGIELYCNRYLKKKYLKVVFSFKASWILYIEILSSVIRECKPRSNMNAHDMSSKQVRNSVWIRKNQLDVTFCIIYFSSNSCSTCFGQPCAHHQELTTA